MGILDTVRQVFHDSPSLWWVVFFLAAFFVICCVVASAELTGMRPDSSIFDPERFAPTSSTTTTTSIPTRADADAALARVGDDKTGPLSEGTAAALIAESQQGLTKNQVENIADDVTTKTFKKTLAVASQPALKNLVLHQHVRNRKKMHKALIEFMYGLAPFVHSLRVEAKQLRDELRIRDDLNDEPCETPDDYFELVDPNDAWIESRKDGCRWHHYPVLFCTAPVAGVTYEKVPFTMHLLRHLSPYRIDIDDLKRRGINKGKILSAGFLWLQAGDCFNHEAQMLPQTIGESHRIFILHFQLVGKSEMHGDTSAFSTALPLGAPSVRPDHVGPLTLEPGDLCVHNPTRDHVLRCTDKSSTNGSVSLYVFFEVS